MADRFVELEARVAAIEERLNALPPRKLPVVVPSLDAGHRCGMCKSWVPAQTSHACSGLRLNAAR